MRIGRRGSVNINLEVKGKQGHAAYPDKVINPIHKISGFLKKVTEEVWDNGNEHFPPTSLQLTNITAGVGAHNVTPNNLYLKFNLRFSPEITADHIKEKITAMLAEEGVEYEIDFDISALPYYSTPALFTEVVKQSIKESQELETQLSCTGGTSDGRFLSLIHI